MIPRETNDARQQMTCKNYWNHVNCYKTRSACIQGLTVISFVFWDRQQHKHSVNAK